MTYVPTPFVGGGQVKTPVDSFPVSGAPSTADIHHNLGTLAIDAATGAIYGLAGKSGGSASWKILGGTGPFSPATLTNHGVVLGQGTANVVATAALSNGEILIGSTGADAVPAHLTPGNGIVVAEGAGTLSVGVSTGGYTPSSVAGTTQALAVQSSYIANNSAQTTFTLPSTAAVGDTILITTGAANTGGFKIAQNAGQTCHSGASATTTGVAGTITSAAAVCQHLRLMCIVANTDFLVLDAGPGAFTFA